MTERERETQRQDQEYAQIAKNYTEASDLHMRGGNCPNSSNTVKE